MKLKCNKTSHIFQWILFLAASFFTCVFLLADRNMKISSLADFLKAMGGNQIHSLCIIIPCFIVYKKIWDQRSTRSLLLSIIGGFIFSLCDFLGYNIYFCDSLFRTDTNVFSFFLDCFYVLGAFFTFTGILMGIFHLILMHPITRSSNSKLRWLGSDLYAFLVQFGLLMLVSISLQIFFYPGITNPDSFTQISEAMGMTALTDRHPFIHTLMMRGCINLGKMLFGTIASGIAFYTFFQSCLVSLTISFTIVYMAQRGIHPILRMIVFLYFLIHPAIACYSITLWKDIWLSYFLLLYTLLLIEAVINPNHFFSQNKNMIAMPLIILVFLFCKNTGILILMGITPFLLLTSKKYWKKIVFITILSLIVLGVVRSVLIPKLNIEKGRPSEPFSVPLQQLARTVTHSGDQLTEEERQLIQEILPLNEIPQIYQPFLSDNIKLALNEDVLFSDPIRYTKLWAELGKKHPRDYLESWLANSCGYWYPDVIYWVVDPSWYFTEPQFMSPDEGKDPDALMYDVDPDAYARRHYFVHLYEMLQIFPGISSLLSVAITFWADFIVFLICLLKKKYKMLIPLIVSFMSWLICIMSPVIAEYRYAFPAVVCLPILAVFILQDDLTLTEKLGIDAHRKSFNRPVDSLHK